MKDVWDRIATSQPVDKAAATAVSQSGVHYVHTPAITQWDAPPEMRPIPENAPDLIGVKFGRLTVIGLHAGMNSSNGATWVVRCVCGTYEPRKAKAIRNPKNSKDACHSCRNVEYLRTARPGMHHVADMLRRA